MGLILPLPAGFGGTKTQEIQLPDGFLTSGGAEGFGNEVFGAQQNPAQTRSRRPSPFRTRCPTPPECPAGAPAAHKGLLVPGGTCVTPLLYPDFPRSPRAAGIGLHMPILIPRIWDVFLVPWGGSGKNKRIWRGGFWGCACSLRSPGLLCLFPGLCQLGPASRTSYFFGKTHKPRAQNAFSPAKFPGRTHSPEETQQGGRSQKPGNPNPQKSP